MPNCFTLTLKGEKEPTKLNKIDEHICSHFGYDLDDDRYAWSWYDMTGFSLACGKTLDEIITGYEEELEKKGNEFIAANRDIAVFLREHYTTNAWAER